MRLLNYNDMNHNEKEDRRLKIRMWFEGIAYLLLWAALAFAIFG